MEEKYVFGIDLGTTYSCISYLDENGQTVVCPSIEGDATTPSVVRLEEDSDPIVGAAAKNTAVIYPSNTIQFVKARIGKDVSFNYGPDLSLTTTPIAVSAEILKKLANDAGSYTNSLVKRVVITVPAYFGDPEKKATRQAGIDAGLDVLGVVEEPTAAALYYGVSQSDADEDVIVFDLGGGTFDVTAMHIRGNSYTVITTEGDHDLGGKNWDAALIELVKSKFEEATGWDEEYDSDAEQELIINAEKAKVMLTGAKTASIPVNMDRLHKAAIQITREEFDACTATLMDRAVELTRKVLDRVGTPINKLLLVGGSTYMPQVKEALEAAFPGMTLYINEPNSAVSKGASIYAFKLLNDPDSIETPDTGTSETPEQEAKQEETRQERKQLMGMYEEVRHTLGGLTDIEIHTVATKSLGLRIMRNDSPAIYTMIRKDTVLPAEHTEEFSTYSDNSKLIPLDVYQINNYEDYNEIDEDLKIGTAMMKIHTALPKGAPLRVTFQIKESGLVYVHGVDLTHNCEIEATIENDAIGQSES